MLEARLCPIVNGAYSFDVDLIHDGIRDGYIEAGDTYANLDIRGTFDASELPVIIEQLTKVMELLNGIDTSDVTPLFTVTDAS